jgi:beta-lactam-binding protein with PASTA domain
MANDADLNAICSEYLERLRGSLADLPPEDQRQIVEQVSEHISSARAALPQQTEAAVRDILERLGTPQEIAASAALEGEERFPDRPKRLLIGTAAAVVLVVFGVGIAALAGAFTTSSPSTVRSTVNPSTSSTTEEPVGTLVVPTLLGESLAQATQTLHALGLGHTVNYTHGPQPPGTVLIQEPTGGSRVVGSSKVVLTVSGSASSVNEQALGTVPNVIGQSEAEAAQAVTAAGFDVQVITKPGGSAPPGTVLEEAPVAGSRAASPQAIVVLTVS